MNLYHRMIENPLFYKWIYHPSPEINSYWDHFLEQHPDEAEIILQLKEGFEKHLKYKTEQLSRFEKKELANQILRQLKEKEKSRKYNRIVYLTLRYAAVAFFFLLIGSGITYILINPKAENHFATYNPPATINLQKPTLILDNKKEIVLNQGKSELSYSEDGNITVNGKKIIEGNESNPVIMNTLVIPYGNHSNITLADGTKVWLNAGSRLIYPTNFVNKTREVFLVGEAFFEVTKNEKKPFLVKTPDAAVKVLGTQFNITAYTEDQIVQTVLKEGSVEVGLANSGLFERKVEIKPGQMAVLNKTDKNTKVYDVEVEYYTSWKQGYLSFYDIDLNRVVKKLERYFDINIRYEDPLDGTLKISGKLDINKSQDIVFEYMNSLTGLNFIKINENNYLIR